MKRVLFYFTSFQSSFISHNASRIKKRHTDLYQRKVLVVITNVNKNSYVCTNFSKTPQYEISLKPSQLLLYFFHAARRTGGKRHGWTKIHIFANICHKGAQKSTYPGKNL